MARETGASFAAREGSCQHIGEGGQHVPKPRLEQNVEVTVVELGFRLPAAMACGRVGASHTMTRMGSFSGDIPAPSLEGEWTAAAAADAVGKRLSARLRRYCSAGPGCWRWRSSAWPPRAKGHRPPAGGRPRP
ncbi:hypothetical protein GCM10010252_77340 [Streptomyces aureoverticillatus]|nr:hypothetical protein GCM10010252_77340 [Streptomyces aureoverticillatus]